MKRVKSCLEKSGVSVSNCQKIGSRTAGVDASARNRTLSRLIQLIVQLPPDFEESLSNVLFTKILQLTDIAASLGLTEYRPNSCSDGKVTPNDAGS
jgi:hypothetical protein